MDKQPAGMHMVDVTVRCQLNAKIKLIDVE